MIKRAKHTYDQIMSKFQVKKPWDNIIIFALNILIAIPAFMIVHQNLIDYKWTFKLDRILLFVILLIVIQLVLRAMRRITLISIFLYLVALVYGTVFGSYGFKSVFEDYQAMLYSMNDNPFPQDIIVSKLLPFPNKTKIIKAIDFQNPKVRDFAIMATIRHFKGVREYGKDLTMVQCFAVFKEINSRWHYVSDPKGMDYIASADESSKYLSGDCDDHSILMAACIRAIGGTPRLIHTDGHMYPELLIGNKANLEKANYLIKKILFANESEGKKINYHIDEHGQIWLNLDYTANYPGGPFLNEEILGALTLD
ncbi:transglutaminase [Flavobacterium sp. SUN046]|uniref:transglutaminase n=1 Tax=Flavobacterium sp. SUN046 TaxID=3002440 RepID=UPI003FA391B6